MLKLKRLALILGVGMLLMGGCQSSSETSFKCPIQKIQNAPPDELNDSPLVVDGAMQIRDWQRVSADYGNGDTPAGPTGFIYESRWNQPEWTYAFTETPVYIGQTVALPFVFIFIPPWTPVTYKGATVETTYTAMPALPGGDDQNPGPTPAPEATAATATAPATQP